MLKLDISQRPDFDPTSASDALPAGTQADRYQLLEAIDEDDFGIVYRAVDVELDCHVAIKEYFPRREASRGEGGRVEPRDQGAAAAFEAGVRAFAEDARALQPMQIRSVVRVIRVWLANGTAYRAMPWLEGQLLAERFADGLPIETLLDAVQAIHRRGHVHRRLSPERVFVTADSAIVLFGFRTRTPDDASTNADDDANPCRPIELLQRSPMAPNFGLPGPWSDVYSLGAMLHLMVTGSLPSLAGERLLKDEYQALGSSGVAGHDPHLLHGIDWALSVLPDRRPRDVAQLRRRLRADKPSITSRSRSLAELVQEPSDGFHLRDLPRGGQAGHPPSNPSPLTRRKPAESSPEGMDFASTRPMVYGESVVAVVAAVPVHPVGPPSTTDGAVAVSIDEAAVADGQPGAPAAKPPRVVEVVEATEPQPERVVPPIEPVAASGIAPEDSVATNEKVDAPKATGRAPLDEAVFNTKPSVLPPIGSATGGSAAPQMAKLPESPKAQKPERKPLTPRARWATGVAVAVVLAILSGATWWVLDPWLRPTFETPALEMHAPDAAPPARTASSKPADPREAPSARAPEAGYSAPITLGSPAATPPTPVAIASARAPAGAPAPTLVAAQTPPGHLAPPAARQRGEGRCSDLLSKQSLGIAPSSTKSTEPACK